MKNLFFLLLVLSNLRITAQSTYLPLVSPQNEWVVDYKDSSFPVELRRYSFNADSMLLNGKYYHELLYSKSMSGGPWEQTYVFYREKNGKVYVKWYAPNQAERLVYDFDMVINDTLVPNAGMKQKDRRITNVGTLKLLDNVSRKFLEMQSSACPGGSTTWIEAMGDRDYLFQTDTYCALADENVYRHIRCFSTNGQLLYKRPDLASCYTSSVLDPGLPTIGTFPNPASDFLFFDVEEDAVLTELRLYNAYGQLINHLNTLQDDQKVAIDFLPNGFYTGTIKMNDGQLRAFRFVVQQAK